MVYMGKTGKKKKTDQKAHKKSSEYLKKGSKKKWRYTP
jgi:hypothetical protein